MNTLISVIAFIAQLALAAAVVLIGASVLLTIAWFTVNAVRRARGVAPLSIEDFMRKCGMELAPKGWPFKRRAP